MDMRERLKNAANWVAGALTWRPAVADCVFLLIITVCYFALPVFLASDSGTYIDNAYVLEGGAAMDQWHAIRGPVLPVILRVGFAFFGESTFGTAVYFYLYYLVFVGLGMYAVQLLGLYEKLGRWLSWLLATVFLFLNPTVLAYAHHVLTEFFALLFVLAALCLLLKTRQLLQRQALRLRPLVLVVRCLGTALLTVVLFALKQMFFTLPVIMFLLDEALMLVRRFSLKRLAAGVLALVLVVGMVPLWSTVWNGYVEKSTYVDDKFSNQNLAQSTLIDGLRYFRPEERGTVGQPVQIDVMSDGYTEVLDSFTYTFDGTFAGSLHYLASCFARAPGRFVASWQHNYLVIANVRRVIGYDLNRAYFPVTITNHFTDSFETMSWLERYKFMQRGENGYYDDMPELYPQYDQLLDSGLVSNLLFNTGYPRFAYFVYSFTVFCAPLLAAAAFVLACVLRKSALGLFWEKVALLAGGIFGYIFFLAVTASNIDRYGFPVTGLCALLDMLVLVGAAVMLWPKVRALPGKVAAMRARRSAGGGR